MPITLGPVVGRVDHQSARILIEVDRNQEIQVIVRSIEGDTFSETATVKRNDPVVVEFESLSAGTQYVFKVDGNNISRNNTGSFRTPSQNPKKLCFAAVSCNFAVKRGKTDAWSDLRDRYVVPNKIDYLLHLGDQIYGDSAFSKAQSLLENTSAAQRRNMTNRRDQIRDLYRDLYRSSWNHPATRDVLSTVPNLMIWDDHEIRDDWGSREEDSDPDSIAYFIGQQARHVFRQYQRALLGREDQTFLSMKEFETHAHTWGPFGVLFVDQRTGRSFNVTPSSPYLGTEQWKRITEALGPTGFLASVKALVIVTSVPLVFLGNNISNMGSHFMDDLNDHWAYGPHQAEQLKLLKLLRLWKERESGRELLILGGDVHVGGFTNISHDQGTVLQQMITSPISNKPPNWFLFQGLRGFLESEEPIGFSYKAEHSNFTNSRNFGVIEAEIHGNQNTAKITNWLEKC